MPPHPSRPGQPPRRSGPAADGVRADPEKSPAPIGPDPERLFAALAGAGGLVLAVSGGPDSTALMVLVAHWVAADPAPPPVLVVSVDHGLRPEAAQEVRQVCDNAASLGLASRAVAVGGSALRANIQAAARRLRYEALVETARAAGCDTIVTAHHRDDQAETVLLRLTRGSGVFGLAGIASETTIEGVRVVRPLLDLPKAELSAIAAASGLPLADDPTNRDPAYDRVRVRVLLAGLAAEGLTAEALAETARRMRAAADALDTAADALLRANVVVDRRGVASGERRALTDAPSAVTERAVSRLVRAVGGRGYMPAGAKVGKLLAALAAPDAPDVKRTLAGVVCEAAGGRVTFSREWGREGPAGRRVVPGETPIWDGRFRVAVPAGAAGAMALKVAALARARRRPGAADGNALGVDTLPGLYAGDRLIGAPDGIVGDDGERVPAIAADCLVEKALYAPRAVISTALLGPAGDEEEAADRI